MTQLDSPPDSPLDQPAALLAALTAALTAHPVDAQLLVEDHWGERDVRIAVRAASRRGPVVELLCPSSAELGPGGQDRCWDAVVVRNGRRRLWRGPSAGCTNAEVAAFVKNLLDLPAPLLRRRWAPVS